MDDDVRWLEPIEMDIWRAWLEAVSRVEGLVTSGLRRSASMTLDDYEVLVHLSEAEGRRRSMSDLAKRLLHSRSRLSQRVDRLADRGLVVREPCEEDRRVTWTRLTDAGMAKLEAAAPEHLRDVRAALIDLIEPDEREVMAQVLRRIADAGAD